MSICSKNRNIHESYYNKVQYESYIVLHYKFHKTTILVTKYPYYKAKLRCFRTKRVFYDTIRVVFCFTKVSEMRNKKALRRVPLERAMRIELTTKAWEAFVLPLNYARV